MVIVLVVVVLVVLLPDELRRGVLPDLARVLRTNSPLADELVDEVDGHERADIYQNPEVVVVLDLDARDHDDAEPHADEDPRVLFGPPVLAVVVEPAVEEHDQ